MMADLTDTILHDGQCCGRSIWRQGPDTVLIESYVLYWTIAPGPWLQGYYSLTNMASAASFNLGPCTRQELYKHAFPTVFSYFQ